MTADYARAVVEHLVDLWEEEGELLALIEMIPAASHLLIENIAVRPDQQGKGLGERLLHHADVLALSLGLVGALSIVRFRAAIKEPEELAYLFLTISVGLGFGAKVRRRESAAQDQGRARSHGEVDRAA